MPDPLLAISASRSNSETVIKLSGECDHSNVDDLNKIVSEILISENRRIVLDVEELNFMGSCGLTSIERAIETLQPVGGIVVVHKPAWMLKWLLDFFDISTKAVGRDDQYPGRRRYTRSQNGLEPLEVGTNEKLRPVRGLIGLAALPALLADITIANKEASAIESSMAQGARQLGRSRPEIGLVVLAASSSTP